MQLILNDENNEDDVSNMGEWINHAFEPGSELVDEAPYRS